MVQEGTVLAVVHACEVLLKTATSDQDDPSTKTEATADDDSQQPVLEDNNNGADVQEAAESFAFDEAQFLLIVGEILHKLTLEELSRRRIVDDGAVVPLVLICQRSDAPLYLQRKVVNSFATLAAEEGNIQQMAEQGAIWPCLELLSTSTDQQILKDSF